MPIWTSPILATALGAALDSHASMGPRHYGFLANACRARKLARVRKALAHPMAASAARRPEVESFDGYPCPKCRQGHLHPIGPLAPVRWARDG